ncbi:hypothetical protein BU17DRAFT_81206 [Hysterangium stoloniferum]|nr:hypothetical protein BU17DRAFT_81206 [Hysterangium stoloniferum]
MASITAQRLLDALMDNAGTTGRPLEELIQSSDALSGVESQRLRTYFSTNCMTPSKDLDQYGRTLFHGDLDGVKSDFEGRLKNISTSGNVYAVAINQLFSLRWGPTQVPIYNCLLLATVLQPQTRQKVLDVVRWLIDVGVPVDGKDLSGTTALGHSLSTKPTFDPEFATLLINAGGDVNNRNRYGATCAHEFCMVWTPDPVAIDTATQALQFYLQHGGDPNIADNDGVSPIRVMLRVPWLSPLKSIVLEDEAIRKKDGCAFCGSRQGDINAVPLLRCGRCKKVRYCAPPKGCQHADWSKHKRGLNPTVV